ncbi:MAG: hypothetical protein AAFR96_09860 [Planctomycetota bacterium]
MSSTRIRSALTLARRSAPLISAAAGLSVGLLAGHAAAQSSTTPAQADLFVGADAAALLDEASLLLAQGQLVMLSETLARVDDSWQLTAEQTDELADLVASLERRMKTADPVELSVQKAERASARGDLSAMERHLASADREGPLGAAHALQVGELRDDAEAVRASLGSMSGTFESQARDDFDAGRFGRAKSTLMILTRAGVPLSAEADALRRTIFELELSRGAPFRAAEAAALFEPGVLERVASDDLDLPAIALFGDVSFDDQPGVIVRDNGSDPAVDLDGNAGDQPEDQDPPADDILDRSLRAAAQAKLAEANQAYQNATYASAIRLYEELLGTDRAYLSAEQVQQAQDRLLESRVALDQQPGAGGIIEDFADAQQRQRERADAEFNNLLSQADQALLEEETQRARDSVAQARLVLGASREVYAESEFEARRDRMTALLERIAAAEISIQETEAERQTRRLQEEQADQEAEAARTRQNRINEQLDRARALQLDMRYEEALQVLDQVLFLDPNNPAALLMRDIIYDINLVSRYNGILRDRAREFSRLRVDNLEASFPITDLVTYPDDWPRVSLNRGEPVSQAEPPENRRVLAELETQRIGSVNFDNPLSDVVSFIETVSQQNFDVDWQSLELLSIDEQTPVQLRLSNVSVKTILDRLVDKISDPLAPAGWAIQDGIVQIASDEELRRNTNLVIYDIRDLLIEVPDYQDAPSIDLQSVLQSTQGGGGGQSPFTGNLDDNNDEERDRQERIDQIIDIIQNNVDFEGWQANGGDTGFIQELNGSLIIRNTARSHREIQGLLTQIRAQRSMQINVETRFLLVNQDFFEEIGFDIDVYLNAENNQVRVARGNDPTVQGSDFFAFDPGQTAPDSSQGLQRTVSGASTTTDGAGGAARGSE